MEISSNTNALALSNAIQQGEQHPPKLKTATEDTQDKPEATSATDTDKKQDPLKDPRSEESVKLRALQTRDQEVRAHEQAHLSAAGQYAKGGASFTYQRGPDGRSYAVGGEVQIDAAPVANDPQATLLKAETIRRAALAPASPSGQDRAVAAQATGLALEARSEIQTARIEEQKATQDLEQKFRQSGALDSEFESDTTNHLDTFI